MRISAALTGGIALLIVCATSAAAQQPDPGLRGRTHIGGGYVVNLPGQMLGFNAVMISPALRNWGVYADFKKILESRMDEISYDPDMTVEEAEGFGDRLMETESEWQTLNVGIIRVVSPALALYVGAGRSEESVVRRYFDQTATRGVLGTYWIDDSEASGTRINGMAGGWFRMLPSFLVQFGVETKPRGATVGISYILPIGR